MLTGFTGLRALASNAQASPGVSVSGIGCAAARCELAGQS